MRNQYVAIDHGNTAQHSNLPVLQLANNRRFAKQSYVNLDQFFTIEAAYLRQWGLGKERLAAHSLDTIERAFLAFITRERTGLTAIDSPLDYRLPTELTAKWLGVKDSRFSIPPRRNTAITIVNPSLLTPPSTPPVKNPLRPRANGAQSFQTTKMGMLGK